MSAVRRQIWGLREVNGPFSAHWPPGVLSSVSISSFLIENCFNLFFLEVKGPGGQRAGRWKGREVKGPKGSGGQRAEAKRQGLIDWFESMVCGSLELMVWQVRIWIEYLVFSLLSSGIGDSFDNVRKKLSWPHLYNFLKKIELLASNLYSWTGVQSVFFY